MLPNIALFCCGSSANYGSILFHIPFSSPINNSNRKTAYHFSWSPIPATSHSSWALRAREENDSLHWIAQPLHPPRLTYRWARLSTATWGGEQQPPQDHGTLPGSGIFELLGPGRAPQSHPAALFLLQDSQLWCGWGIPGSTHDPQPHQSWEAWGGGSRKLIACGGAWKTHGRVSCCHAPPHGYSLECMYAQGRICVHSLSNVNQAIIFTYSGVNHKLLSHHHSMLSLRYQTISMSQH